METVGVNMSKTDNKIKQSATKLLLKYGLYGTSVSKIIKEAEVSNGSFYHFYHNIEELINDIYYDFGLERVKLAHKAFFEGNTIKSSYFNMYKEDILWARNNVDKINFIRMFSNSNIVTSSLSSFGEDYLAPIQECIKNAIKTKEIQSLDIEENLMRWNAATDVAIQYLDTNHEVELEKYLDYSFNCFWRRIA
jgi:AcrR family transcriptional regulator